MAETEDLDSIQERYEEQLVSLKNYSITGFRMSCSLPKDTKLSPELIHQGFSQNAKSSNLVSPIMTQRNFPKISPSGMFPPNSPLTLRSRKVTSPSSTSFSFLSASDHLSSLHQSKLSDSTSDISEVTTPISTPLLGRKRTSSNSFEIERFPPAPSSTMSRSSSTLSLCSNVSQATSGLPPLDRLLKHSKLIHK